MSEQPRKLLVIEDDPPLGRLLCSWLRGEGFVAALAQDGEEGLARARAEKWDLVLMDLNLPKLDGLSLLSALHAEFTDLPVLVLTGRNSKDDLVAALGHGADDYLAKPVSLIELLARLRALLRRTVSGVSIQASAAIPEGPLLTLNREEFRVERSGRRIELTPREFSLLEFLLEQSPKAVSRVTLMEKVWCTPFDPSTNIVDVYMKYLRDKIDAGHAHKLIRTVRGVGYALSLAPN